VAVDLRTPFGGINSDIPPGRTPSGTADTALNVVMENGVLQKRLGFSQFEDNVAGGSAVKNIAVATFDDGDTYVAAKLATGAIYERKSSANAFTLITAAWTHNAADPGWWFFWRNFLHYGDRAGVSRWDPDRNSGVFKKAGILRPATTLTVGATGSGAWKNGTYKATYSYRNSVTEEESLVAVLSAGQACNAVAGTILTLGNWDAIQALTERNTYDNVDQAVFYCTNGNGLNRTHAYKELTMTVVTDITQLSRTDAQHNPAHVYTNAGGEPPGSQIGCLTARNQAIYGLVWVSAALVPGEIRFSKVGFPCMIPTKIDVSVDSGVIEYYDPLPYEGKTVSGFGGNLVAMSYGGGRAFAFTPSKTYAIEEGNVYPVLIDNGRGCDGALAAIGTKDAVYAINGRSLNRVYGGVQDMALNRFGATLETVPAAYRSLTVMGYYSYKRQLWAAVTKAGATVPQRILVLDLVQDALTMFDIAGLAAGEYITCMTEYAYSGATPTMLIGTSAGRILQYPSATVGDVNVSGTTVHYAAQWRGYYGQERIFADQRLEGLTVHAGASCAANVTVGLRCMKESGAGETVTASTATLSKSSKQELSLMDFDRVDGSFFQVDINSANTVQSQWKINDLTVRLARTK
jgi:hypothetical protein